MSDCAVTLVLKKKPKKILGVMLGTRRQALRRDVEMLKHRDPDKYRGLTEGVMADYYLEKGIEYVQVSATDVRAF